MATTQLGEVQKILKDCEGQEIKIPYLMSLCPNWHPSVNSYNEDVQDACEVWRQRYAIVRKLSFMSWIYNS